MTEQRQDEIFHALLDVEDARTVLHPLPDTELVEAGEEAVFMLEECEGSEVEYTFWRAVVDAFNEELAARFGGNERLN
jgi:hypothetical protein